MTTPLFVDDVIVVIGCADLTTVGEDGAPHWMKRNGDLAIFGCNVSSATWQLKCDGDRWVGERGVCPGVSSAGGVAIVTSFQSAACAVTEKDALFTCIARIKATASATTTNN